MEARRSVCRGGSRGRHELAGPPTARVHDDARALPHTRRGRRHRRLPRWSGFIARLRATRQDAAVDRALRRDELTLALGELQRIPSPDELQQLLADAELSLFAARPEIPDDLVRTGWYLHAIASTGADRIEWARRATAFRISAHIL